MTTQQIDPELKDAVDAAMGQLISEPGLLVLVLYLQKIGEKTLPSLEAEMITLRQQNEDLKASVAKVSLQLTMLRQALEATEREFHA